MKGSTDSRSWSSRLRPLGLASAVLVAAAIAGCEGGCRRSPSATEPEKPKSPSPTKEAAEPATPSAARSPGTDAPAPPAATATAPPPSESKPAPTLPAEDRRIEPILRDLATLWDGVSTFSANVETEMNQALSGPGKTRGLGLYHLQKSPGQNPKLRYAMRNNLSFPMGEEHWLATEVVVWVSDGEFLYQQTRQPEIHRVEKRRYDPALVLPLGGRDLLNRLRAENVLTLADETKFDGRDAYVINAVTKDTGDRSVHTFDKVTGARLLWQELGADEKPVLSVKLFNLSLTPEIAEDEFTFVVPEDAKLIDETK